MDGDLFELGMDSLSAMRLLQLLRQSKVTATAARQLQVAQILGAKACRDLIPLLSDTTVSRDAEENNVSYPNNTDWSTELRSFEDRCRRSALLGLDERTRMRVQKILPTTATQSGMLTSFLTRPASIGSKRSYINHTVYHFSSVSEACKFFDAFRTVLQKHDIYRTVFVPVDDKLAPFAQCVLSPASDDDNVSTHTSSTAIDACLKQHLEQIDNAISLEQPPWHLGLLAPPQEDEVEQSVVVLSLMHAIFDGGSLDLLQQEVVSLLRDDALQTSLEVRCTELEATVQHHFTSDLESSRRFWHQRLEGVSRTRFPCANGYKATEQSALGHASEVTELYSRSSMDEIVKQARCQRTSALVLLQTAWNLVLAVYTEDESLNYITSGSVHSGRLDEQTQSCMAPTFNVIPFITRLDQGTGNSATLTSAQLLAEATQASTAGLSHLEIPLGALARSGGMPFDTLFAVQRFDAQTCSNATVPWASISYPVMANDFAVMVEVWPGSKATEKMRLRLTYSLAVLDAPSAQLLLQQYEDILHSLMREPETTTVQQLINGEGLRQSALSVCRGPLASENDDSQTEAQLLHSYFENKAATEPEAIALEFYFNQDSDTDGSMEVQRWTYFELNAQANRLARYLLSVTGKPTLRDLPIPICMERCPELYVSVLATLKAGGAWCPIDVQSPRARQLELIARTKSRVVLVTPNTSADLGEVQADGQPLTIKVNACDTSQFHHLSADNLRPTATPATLAYLIWTSGTTGAPKGVMIEHASAVASMQALQQHVKPLQQDMPPRCLQFSAYTFDVFVQDLFWTWGLGGAIIAATREIMLGSTAELIAASQTSHAHLTPAFAAGLRRDSCPSITSVTFIGEKLTESVAADWTSSCASIDKPNDSIAVYNTYGPAEVTVVATLRQLFGGEKLQSANVGVPMQGVTAIVCKNREQPIRPCAKGSIGELVLAGAQVGRGYLNDKAKTEAAFTYSPEWKQRLYYTGDYVRMLHDGSIEFIGRRDDLVKLGGIRVELSEISAALLSVQERRKQAAVVERVETMMLSRLDRPTKQVISFLACPYLAASTDRGVHGAISEPLLLTSGDAIQLAHQTLNNVRDVLPPYMVPSMVLVLSRIPQTASAKIDRAKLQAAYDSADLAQWVSLLSTTADDPDNPEGEDGDLQCQVIAAISEITGTSTQDINSSSSLASIGLDSIRAIRLAAKLKQNGTPLPISTLLACSTVRMLICGLATKTGDGHEVAEEDTRNRLLAVKLSEFDKNVREMLPTGSKQDFEVCIPCSTLQEGMLAETLADPAAYWSDHVLQLDSHIDLARLAEAWRRAAHNIEMLRTVFAVVSQTAGLEEVQFDKNTDVFALQMVHKSVDITLIDVCDPIRVKSDDRLHQAVSKWTRSVAQDRADNVFATPLWKVKTFVVQDDSSSGNDQVPLTYAALCIHHALYDGPSIDIILNRVRDEYSALSPDMLDDHHNIRLLPTTSLSTQSEFAYACVADEQRESILHWEQKLQPRGPAAMLPDLTSVKNLPSDAKSARFIAASRKLQCTSARPQGVGLSALIKSAFAIVLAQYVEAEDQRHVVLGEILSLRNLHATLSTEQGAVGPLLTTQPFSLLLDAALEQKSAASYLQSNVIVHPSMQHRFASLASLAKIMGTRSDQEMFTAMYVYHPRRQPVSVSTKPIWTLLEDRSSEIRVEHSTVLNVFEHDDVEDSLILELSMKEDRISKDMLETLLDQVVSLLTLLLDGAGETLQALLGKVGQDQRELASVSHVPRGSRHAGDGSEVDQGHDPLFWLQHYAKNHPSWLAVVIAAGTPETACINDAELSSWTYAQLNAKADQVARLIRSLDLPSEGPIALCMQRSLISIAVTVAIFKCGRTYLPIDDQLPTERKRLLISDSRCALVVTEGTCLGELEADCISSVLNVSKNDFEQSLAALSHRDDHTELTSIKPRADDGAYLLYTSGSTGKPKGVLVGRANLCSFIDSYAEVVSAECPSTLQLGGKGRYLGLAGRAFDVHLSQMFMSWRFGLALATGERPLLLGDLKATVQTMSITHMSCVPSLLDQCDLVPQEVPSLVFLGVGGEKLTDRVRDTLASSLTVLNAYGPTETTIMCTVNRVHPHSHVRDIGQVLPGNTAVVIDFDDKSRFAPVIRGRAGELCIRGDLVALGYHALDPSQMATSGFVTTPDGTRMYRTGDAARMMADGSLHYLGRRDEQEKIRGQRLELGEVSRCAIAGADESIQATTLICQHESLAKPLLITLIATKTSSTGDQRRDTLPQFLAPSTETGRLAQHVLQYCKQHLPSYMVPDLVVGVSHLTQLAASGKTDVRRLKAWLAAADPTQLFSFEGRGHANAQSGSESNVNRPLSSLEREIASAIRRMLPKCPAEIRPDTSIFDLGIDSLSVIRLAGQLRKEGLAISIGRLRMHPRVQDIAAELSDSQALEVDLSVGVKALESFQARHQDQVQASRVEKVTKVLPCLPSQEGMVAISLSSKDEPVYVARIAVRFNDIQPEATAFAAVSLRRAWRQLSERHSILRTCFDHVDDVTIAQIVLDAVDIQRHIVTTKTQNSTAAIARAILQDITVIPPWRIELDDKAGSEPTFVLHMHHALYDGHSLPLLLNDLARVIQSIDDDGPESHDQQPGVQEMLESILSVSEQRAERFWRNTFADFPVNDPSVWTSIASVQGRAPLRCKATVQLAPLEAAAKTLQVTLSSLVASALGIALCRSLETTAFTVGFVLWGRSLDHVSAESIVAPCLTTVPMPFALCADRGSRHVGELIRACHDWNSSCLAFQHTSMRQIRRWIGSECRGSLVDLLYSFVQAGASNSRELARTWHLDSVEAETDAPAAVEVTADRDRDELRISAMARHLLPHDGLEGMTENLQILLNKIANGTGTNMDLKAAGIPTSSVASKLARELPSHSAVSRPLTAAEEQIRDLAVTMCGVPNTEMLQLDTPFLRIGLDSIVALRFSARLRREHGLQLSAHDVLAAGTIAGLSKLLDQRQAEGRSDATVSSSLDSTAARYKATPLQAGMLNGTLASASHDLYVHHHAVLLKQPLDHDRLQRALQHVVASHDILRTSFHLEGEPSETKNAVNSLSWYAQVTPFESLRSATEIRVVRSDKTASAALKEYGTDFIFDGPEKFNVSPWCAAILHCTSSQDVLVISMHHSLYDGVSLPSMFADLRASYHDLTHELVQRPPFSKAADLIASSAHESEQYWLKTLIEFKQPSLLVKKSSRSSTTPSLYRLDERRLSVSLATLKRLSAELGATPQAIAMLSWSKVLAVAAGQRDVCFGQVVSGRYLNLPGIEDVSGPLINTVPIRINLIDDLASNAVTARDLQERIVAAQPFQHASLGRIQNAWRREHGAHSTFFDTLFVFHNIEGKSSSASSSKSELWTALDPSEGPIQTESSTPTVVTTAASEYPVNISVIQDDDGVQIKAGASDAVGGIDWLPKTLQLFEQVFLDLLERPHRSVGAFPERLAALPLTVGRDGTDKDTSASVGVDAGRRSLSTAEQDIVLRHMAKRLNVDAAIINSCPNLFLLGIDSLLAICISADARSEQVPLTPFDVLSAGTFARLTVATETRSEAPRIGVDDSTDTEREMLVGKEAEQEAIELLKVPSCEVETVLPLLTGQQQHIAQWLQRGRRFLEPTFVYACPSKLDVSKLKSAWNELRRRNAALRTAFVRLKDRRTLVQVVLAENSLVWRDHERGRLGVVDGSNNLDAAAFEAVQRLNASPTDLFRPSARLTLVQGKQSDLVLVTIHHTSYDAWSMRLMADELMQLYHNIDQGKLESMRAPVSFADFIDQTHREALRNRDATASFWETRLRGASATLVCRGATQSLEQTMHVRKPALQDVDTLEAACRARGFGLQVVVILAYARLLSSEVSDTKITSPTFGFYTAGRASAIDGVGNMIGPTTAMQPMTVATAGGDQEDLFERLRAIQTDLVSRAEHQQDYVDLPVAFDAHLNLLWHKPITTSMRPPTDDSNASAPSLLKPYRLPYDSGYFTRHPLMPGNTSVDGDIHEAGAQLYMDVGLDASTKSLSLGARCDRSAMDAQQLEAFCDRFVGELEKIRAAL